MSTQTLSRDWLSVVEVAELLGKHPETVRRWCRSGAIKARQIKREWFIPKSILDTLVKGDDR